MISLLVSSCDKSFNYKYQEKPQLISCAGADAELLNEALYTFFDDISSYYQAKFIGKNGKIGTFEAYSNFIYVGAMGTADYKNIATAHTLNVLSKLRQEKELWNKVGDSSKLNYQSKFVTCLIERIENNEMKTTLKSLIKVNFLSPKIMAERFRVSNREALEDPNYAMFVALDTYYRYLLDIDHSIKK
jgi:hypothetical protein